MMNRSDNQQDTASAAAARLRRENIKWAKQRLMGTIDYLREGMRVASGRLLLGNAAGAVLAVTVLADSKLEGTSVDVAFFTLGLFSVGVISGTVGIICLLGYLDKERKWCVIQLQDVAVDEKADVGFEIDPPFEKFWARLIAGAVVVSLLSFIAGVISSSFAIYCDNFSCPFNSMKVDFINHYLVVMRPL